MTRIASGVTDQGFYFVAADATDLKTREPGLSSFTVVRSRNGAADATMTTPTVTEIDGSTMPGIYWLLCDEDMTIDSGDEEQEMCYHITHAGMHPVTHTVTLFRPKITAGETLTVASGVASANAVQLSGDSAAADNAEAFFDGTGYAGTNNVIPTVTTVTNLTNAPTNGDLTATMKTSVTTAATAATPTAAAVTGAVGSVTGNVGGNVTGSVGSLSSQAKADVNAEVVDCLNVDTYAEPGQEAPPATTTLVKKIGYAYKFSRNKITSTATTISVFSDDGTTVDQKSTHSDDLTTYTRGELVTGP